MDPRMPLADVPAYARRVESIGYDAMHVPETVHDAFAVSLLALEHTTRLDVRTSVLVAFPRSPMQVAYAAWGLQSFSGGRFSLGLGTQIRANIRDRYSVAWSDPVGRMREYVGALRAIFASFASGEPLRYEGEHYRFARLQPYFRPEPSAAGPPAIWLGGVNERMCALAGEVADGFVTHPTSSNRRYLSEVCLPNLRDGMDLVVTPPVATGPAQDAVARAREHQRRMLAFLYSTPAYRRTLEQYGWSELGSRLQVLTRDGRWDELSVPDEVLDELVVQGTYEELPHAITRCFGGTATGVQLPVPDDPRDDVRFGEVLRMLRVP